jgi:hypothetical protein
MGNAPDLPIEYDDKETMCQLVAAMAFVECGQPIPMDKIEKGYQMT